MAVLEELVEQRMSVSKISDSKVLGVLELQLAPRLVALKVFRALLA